MAIDGVENMDYSTADGLRFLAFVLAALVMIFVEPLYGVFALALALVAISVFVDE